MLRFSSCGVYSRKPKLDEAKTYPLGLPSGNSESLSEGLPNHPPTGVMARSMKSVQPAVLSTLFAVLLFPGQFAGLGNLWAQPSNDQEDPFANSGNIKPVIVELTAAQEAAILEDVSVPDEFDVTLFAPAATANYPVYVAASPAGDLYVSSDGNGSLGRQPDRGRVLRLRDQDGDGRADQVTEFVPNIDSPRGLIWDHDRLYLLHPPHISVFYDRDGDGVAEDSQRLIEGIAFGFEDRPADHTTNGLELGIDGWIYIAGGDFGFLDAVGTDGRHLQHRGGGVIRFRPDGSGLELFATGTRNILGTPTSPLLDMFARDNTNDGGGWDVRLHHFTGLEDHGYPRLYMNFPEEHIHPLADYGGGSGCGSVYIHEPGFPAAWNNAPFTCDWGRAAVFHHTVERQGATFKETKAPETFIKMTRPTDGDVDAMSQVYQASWKGPATFNWNGPDVGYIVRVKPKDFTADPLPDYDHLTDAELVAALDSPSHIRTLTAQRTLLRREFYPSTQAALLNVCQDPKKELRIRVAALYAVTQRGIDSGQSDHVIRAVSPLLQDSALKPFVLRALGDLSLDRLTAGEPGPAPTALIEQGLSSTNPRSRIEAMVTAARQKNAEPAASIAEYLGHSDPVIAHTAYRSLALLGASDPCFAILDATGTTPEQKMGAAFALMRMHRADVVDNLIGRLDANPDGPTHKAIIAALSRLYQKEANWTGDSWGTRPDTRGPYYQLTTWSESEKILTALKHALDNATPTTATALIKEMNRNRIQSNAALERVIELASQDESLASIALSQLAEAEDIPESGIPIIFDAAAQDNAAPATLAQIVTCLTKIQHPQALETILRTLAKLDLNRGARREQQNARSAYLNHPRLDSFAPDLAELIDETDSSSHKRWAYAAMLSLASNKNTGPEASAIARAAIDRGWKETSDRVSLIQLATQLRNHHLDDRIRAALTDLDDDVVRAARNAMRRLRIPRPGEDTSPKIENLSAEQAIAQVIETKGEIATGESVFMRAACTMCHTVSQDEAQKGPYLGTIASTYRRKELAEAILLPNKTIAQGFATNVITLANENEYTGFITNEAGDQVSLRDLAGQEHVLQKADIVERRTIPTSIMPEGLMSSFSINELAGLLSYLEELAK